MTSMQFVTLKVKDLNIETNAPQFVSEIFKKFEKANYEIYIVGGAVRDVLTGRVVDDWDFTTNATPEEILTVFPDGFYNNKFGTVGIAYDSSPNPYEVTTFRKEFGYSDARRPDKVVWGTSLQEDLDRRDFTINAMALKPTEIGENTLTVELIDILNGRADLDKGVIRTVGNPDIRFVEDALRLMRAIRLASELGFKIEKNTLSSIKSNANLINKIARERVKEELLKTLGSDHSYDGVVLLKESGLMLEILPELEKTFGVEQKSPGRHHVYDVGTHSLLSLKFTANRNPDPITRFAVLIHDIGKPQTYMKLDSGTITFYNHEIVGAKIAKQIADRLRFSEKEKDKLWRLVRYHQFTVNESQTDSAVRRFIRNVTPEHINDMLDLRVGDRLGGGARETSWRLEEFKKRLIEVQKQPFSIKDLKINGNDVMNALNIKPGPKVGETLSQLFEEVVEKKIENDHQALLNRANKLG